MKCNFKRIQVASAEVPVRDIPTPQAPIDTAEVPVRDIATVKVPDGAHLPELSSKFLLAGRALFTVQNTKGEHYTYKVRKKESVYQGKPSVGFFVSVKASGGVYPYRYVGMLNETLGTIKCTAKSEYLPGTKEYDVVAWACQAVLNSRMIPANYKVFHAGKCGRCGRNLTDETSVNRGIGPECWSRI